MFPVKYELNLYLLFRRISVFEGRMLFREIITDDSENHTNHIKTLRRKHVGFLRLTPAAHVDSTVER